VDHEIIASAIRQWRRRLGACETADGGHFEQPSEHVRLCWTNYCALFRHDIVELFQQNVWFVQFYCYSLRTV